MNINLSFTGAFIFFCNFIIILCLYLFEGIAYYPSSAIYSLLFYIAILSIIILFKSEKCSFTSLMFIFNATIFLFIGGRFLTYFFTYTNDSLFSLHFMASYSPQENHELTIFRYIYVFLFLMNFGYLTSNSTASSNLTKINYKTSYISNKIIQTVCISVFFILLLINIKTELYTLSLVKKYGYLARYNSQGESLSAGSSLSNILLFVFLGLCFSFSNKKLNWLLLLSLFFYSFIILLSGQRAVFVTTFLFSIWYYGLDKRISLKKLIFWFLILIILVIFLIALSPRSTSTSITLLQKIIELITKQGVSLGVITYGISEIESFPVYAYITNFTPGFMRIMALIVPWKEFYNPELGFGSYTAYTANPDMYLAGYGLDWSIIGNFISYSFNSIILFCIISFVWGKWINLIDKYSSISPIYLGLATTIAPNLFFVARSELKIVTHLMIIYLILYALIFTIQSVVKATTYKSVNPKHTP